MAQGNGNGQGKPKSKLGQAYEVLREPDTVWTPPVNRGGVNTASQYFKFRGKYPPIGRGFPRRYIDITPDEFLYDPTRILGNGINAQIIPNGNTVLMQPRVESSGSTVIDRGECAPVATPFNCPPPFTQLPVIKQQVHIEPSRDAEMFLMTNAVDIPASVDGITPGTNTIFSFDTFVNQKFVFKWTQMIVYDALTPSLVTVAVKLDGQSTKWIASPSGTTLGSNGLTYLDTISTPNGLDFSNLPDCCRNSLYEIIDRKHVDVVGSNLALVDRKVEVALWGWIEAITVFDNQVQH